MSWGGDNKGREIAPWDKIQLQGRRGPYLHTHNPLGCLQGLVPLENLQRCRSLSRCPFFPLLAFFFFAVYFSATQIITFAQHNIFSKNNVLGQPGQKSFLQQQHAGLHDDATPVCCNSETIGPRHDETLDHFLFLRRV